MQRDRVLYYAKQLGVQLKEDSHRTWIEGRCPFAPWTHQSGHDNSMSFALSAEQGKRTHYTCLACGEKGGFPALAYKLGQLRGVDLTKIGRQIEKDEIADRPLRVVPEWDVRIDKKAAEIPYIDPDRYPGCFYHPYLRKRGISFFTAQRLALRYDFKEARILFPVMDYTGVLYGYTGRYTGRSDAVKRIKDYYGLPKRELFLGEKLATEKRFRNDPLIIVEGLFDYARLVDAGFPNTLALLGTELTPAKRDKLLMFDRELIWFPDNDAAGLKILYGRTDPVTGKLIENTGVLQTFAGRLPQRIVEYDEHMSDPGGLSNSVVEKLIHSSRYY